MKSEAPVRGLIPEKKRVTIFLITFRKLLSVHFREVIAFAWKPVTNSKAVYVHLPVIDGLLQYGDLALSQTGLFGPLSSSWGSWLCMSGSLSSMASCLQYGDLALSQAGLFGPSSSSWGRLLCMSSSLSSMASSCIHGDLALSQAGLFGPSSSRGRLLCMSSSLSSMASWLVWGPGPIPSRLIGAIIVMGQIAVYVILPVIDGKLSGSMGSWPYPKPAYWGHHRHGADCCVCHHRCHRWQGLSP